jgi:chromosome segregation protein
MEELSRTEEARLDEKARAEAGVEEKREEALSLGSRLKGLYEELGGLRSERTREEEALGAIRERVSGIEGAISALGEKARKVEEEKGTLGFGLKEIELQAANLEEKLAERYGLGLGDLPASSTVVEGHARPEEGGGTAREVLASLREEREALHAKILAMGEVSLSALEEYRDLEERHTFLLAQQEDLTRSVEGLMKAIARINRTSRSKFRAAFDEINARFKENFPKFFRGGHAELRLTDETNILESGIDIVAQPPGKKLQNISLLSGGEKALTAVSLIFSIFLIKPSPFCLLDEVDAPLDEANIDRFNAFVHDISDISQFILITHNKQTMEVVDRLYGVTMEEPGVSKIVSVRF